MSTNIKIKIYIIGILPIVLYGCETWSLVLNEKCGLRVFENRVWRRIFGPKKEEVKGEWRKSYIMRILTISTTAHQTFFVWLNKKMKWVGHIARTGRGDVYAGF